MAISIQYELDKTRNIKLDTQGIKRYEALTGKIFMEIDMSKISTTDQLILIWAGLYHEDTETTLAQVECLVDQFSDITKLYEITISAIMGTLPKAKPIDKKAVSQGKNAHRA